MSASGALQPAAAARALRIALVAGEESGDLLGAGLIEALRARLPAVEFAGIGGPRMQSAGMQIWWPAADLAVMGLTEVLRHLPRLLKLRRALRHRLADWQPDLYVGIDAPDFNLAVERSLKRRGVRTAHYVSPSIWAWRASRAARIGVCADRVLCLFPMEPPIYARHGVDARFVGHPLADQFALEPDRQAARRALGLAASDLVLAVLPGSRSGEVRRLGAIFADAARKLRRERPQLRVIAPMANAPCRALFAPLAGDEIELIDGMAAQAMIAADVVLLASGTAALEALLAKRPMVVAYRIAPLSYWLVRGLGLMRTPWYSLPNVLAGAELVPERMQAQCNAVELARTLGGLLDDPQARAAQTTRFADIHLALSRDASASAAEALLDLLPAASAPR